MTDCRTIVLGCGHWHPKEPGVLRVDILEGENVDAVYDLEKYPWPWGDETFIHANASHIIEHIENIPKFLDETWRILTPGGTLLLKTPDAISGPFLAFSDPTHRHYLTKWSFINYITPTGRCKFGYSRHEWCILDIKIEDGEITTLLGKVWDNAPDIKFPVPGQKPVEVEEPEPGPEEQPQVFDWNPKQ